MAHDEALSVGQQVVAGEEAIGDLVGITRHHDAMYLHVRRFGPGLDDLYIPSAAIRRVVGKHVYLSIDVETLLGKAWHELPTAPE